MRARGKGGIPHRQAYELAYDVDRSNELAEANEVDELDQSKARRVNRGRRGNTRTTHVLTQPQNKDRTSA